VRRLAVLSCLVLLAVAGCDRNLEPYDPDEKPREPDLSKIFPEGAESAESQQPSLPPAPGEARGAPPLASEPSSEAARSEASRLARSEAKPSEDRTGVPSEDRTGSDAPVTGTVELVPELEGKAPADAVLFIIARRGGGPPLAVKRVPNPHFPLPFTIGPDDRMIQTMPFAGPIALSARIDSDGNATSRSPGDVMGAARGGPVAPGATGVVILLDTQL